MKREPDAAPYELLENLERFFAGKLAAQATEAREEAACCPPAEQRTCCDAEDKAECCGASTGGSCGCR